MRLVFRYDRGGCLVQFKLTHSPIFAVPGAAFPVDAAAATAAGSPTLHASGVEAGAHAGYSWQFGHLVTGIEADIELLALESKTSGIFPFPSTPGATFPASNDVHVDWQATLRPRLGYAENNWLLYATGGVAAAHIVTNQTVGSLVAGAGFPAAFSTVHGGLGCWRRH